jgi:hypothetical protein
VRRPVQPEELEARLEYQRPGDGGRERGAAGEREREPERDREEAEEPPPPQPREPHVVAEEEAPEQRAKERHRVRDGARVRRPGRHQEREAEPDVGVHGREARLVRALGEVQRELHDDVVPARSARLAEQHLGRRRAVEQPMPERKREAVQPRGDERGEERGHGEERAAQGGRRAEAATIHQRPPAPADGSCRRLRPHRAHHLTRGAAG